MRKRILLRSTFPQTATVGFGLVVLILRKNMAELAMSTQSLGIPRGRMSVASPYMVFHKEWGADP